MPSYYYGLALGWRTVVGVLFAPTKALPSDISLCHYVSIQSTISDERVGGIVDLEILQTREPLKDPLIKREF